MLHGECVAIGMVLETKLSQRMGYLTSSFTIGRLIRYLSCSILITQMYTKLQSSNPHSKIFEYSKSSRKDVFGQEELK